MDVWAGRTLRDRDPVWEARLAEIERMEADREAELAAESRRALEEERRQRMMTGSGSGTRRRAGPAALRSDGS